MNQKKLKTICIVLLVIFLFDAVYSFKHPNVGKGITDYDTNNTAYVINSERNIL